MNQEQLEALKSDLVAWANSVHGIAALVEAQDYPALASAYNEHPAIPNPNEQLQVPKQFTPQDVFDEIKTAEAMAIYDRPALLADVKQVITNNDRVAATRLLAMITDAHLLANGSLAAIQTLLAETEPDPTWTATIPGPSRADTLSLPTVRPEHIQAVDHMPA